MKKKNVFALALAAAVVLGITGCGGKGAVQTKAESAPTENSDSKQEEGDSAKNASETKAAGLYPGTPDADMVTINISQDPPQLCSVLSSDSVSSTVFRHTLSNLMKLDANDKPLASVAKDYKVSDDNLTYTFTLRDDMKWSNGEPVTANDFIYSWTQLLTPETGAQYSYMGYVFKNGERYFNGEAKIEDVGFKAVDDYTLEVTLENPYPYFLSLLAFYSFSPLNQKAVEAAGGIDKYANDADTFVTNGPYKVESWTHDDSVILAKNAEYYDAANINIPKIKMLIIADSNTAMNAFKSGELDMIGLSGEQRAMLVAEGQPIQHFATGSSWYFEFNTTRPGLKNKKIRQAMTMAVDVESYIKNVAKNDSIPAHSFTNPVINGVSGKFSDAVGDVVKHDFTEAKKLLEEGLAEEGLTVESFSPTIITEDTDAATRDTAFYQEQWNSNLGIHVNIQQMPFKSRLAKRNQKDYDISLSGWLPDYDDAMTYLDLWLSDGGNNHTGWSNADYDKAIADAIKEQDPQKRQDILVGAEKLLLAEMPIGPIYDAVSDYTCSDKLIGVTRTPFQNVVLNGAKIVK